MDPVKNLRQTDYGCYKNNAIQDVYLKLPILQKEKKICYSVH